MSESAMIAATLAWRLAFAALAVVVSILALMPHVQFPLLGMPAGTENLVRHFLAFAALGTAGGFAWRSTYAVVAGLVAFAVLLELAQFFSPGREVHFDDALAGIAGAVAGPALAAALRLLLRSKDNLRLR